MARRSLVSVRVSAQAPVQGRPGSDEKIEVAGVGGWSGLEEGGTDWCCDVDKMNKFVVTWARFPFCH